MVKNLEKKIVKWTYDYSTLKTSVSFDAAQIDETLDVITIANHPFETGEKVGLVLTAGTGVTSTVPALATDYWIINVDTNTVALAGSAALAYAGTKTALTKGSAVDCLLVKDVFGVIESGIILPLGAIVTGGYIDVKTALTSSGSATISFSTGQGAADLYAATAVATYAANYTTAVLAGMGTGADAAQDTAAELQVLVGASLIEMTANNKVIATVAVAPLTAGKLDLVLEYVV
jgi:general stress protein CsbA